MHSPNEGATNESGFTALPAGFRMWYDSIDNYLNMAYYGYFWCSTEYSSYFAWRRELSRYNSEAQRNYTNYKQNGFSVRCLRD